jgi:hypothetical protein
VVVDVARLHASLARVDEVRAVALVRGRLAFLLWISRSNFKMAAIIIFQLWSDGQGPSKRPVRSRVIKKVEGLLDCPLEQSFNYL